MSNSARIITRADTSHEQLAHMICSACKVLQQVYPVAGTHVYCVIYEELTKNFDTSGRSARTRYLNLIWDKYYA